MLTQFLRWMDKENLVDLNVVASNDDYGHNARFHIQKCVFIAQYLGLETEYAYGRYLNGPYSTSLARDYYAFANREIEDENATLAFDKDACRDIMTSHNKEWLEIATTLIHIGGTETNRERLVKRVSAVKFPYSKKYIRGVLCDLLHTQLSSTFTAFKDRYRCDCAEYV